jgi:hypothetical protein
LVKNWYEHSDVIIKIRKNAKGSGKIEEIRKASGANLASTEYTQEEAIVHLVAHELRHLWQAKVKKGHRVWGARGQYSERDCDAYAIGVVRHWRRRGSPFYSSEGEAPEAAKRPSVIIAEPQSTRAVEAPRASIFVDADRQSFFFRDFGLSRKPTKSRPNHSHLKRKNPVPTRGPGQHTTPPSAIPRKHKTELKTAKHNIETEK